MTPVFDEDAHPNQPKILFVGLAQSSHTHGWIDLLSDSALNVFKEYRAFDDFENQPLHATLLIDGQGLVRWQDISYEPFTDMKFLISESRRLLAVGKGPLVAGATTGK